MGGWIRILEAALWWCKWVSTHCASSPGSKFPRFDPHVTPTSSTTNSSCTTACGPLPRGSTASAVVFFAHSHASSTAAPDAAAHTEGVVAPLEVAEGRPARRIEALVSVYLIRTSVHRPDTTTQGHLHFLLFR